MGGPESGRKIDSAPRSWRFRADDKREKKKKKKRGERDYTDVAEFQIRLRWQLEAWPRTTGNGLKGKISLMHAGQTGLGVVRERREKRRKGPR